MKLIVSTGAFPGYQLQTIFQRVKAAGADGIELLLSSRLADTPVRYFRDLERQRALPILSVHAILRLKPFDAATLRQDIVRSARLASELEQCRTLVVHAPEADSIQAERARVWFSAIEEAARITAGSRCRIAVENSGRLSPAAPTGVFDHPHRLRALVQEWDLALTFDTAHAGSRGWDILETAEILYPQIANVHFSDLGGQTTRFPLLNSVLRDHRLPGQGSLPLDDLLGLLTRRDYRELLTLELSPLRLRAWWPPAAERLLRTTIERCRQASRELDSRPSTRRAQERT